MINPEKHRTHRIGWLRAAVLGANDGIVSTASLIVGVAAAAADRSSILVAGVAGLMAGAMSMAAGEYVSVSSQSDTERADLDREREELASDGDYEHAEFMYHLAAGSTAPALETDDQMFESTYEQTLLRRRQEQAKANFAIGSLAGRQGEYAQAAYYSRRAIDLDSTQASPYVNLISAYLKLGEMHTADSALAAALIRFPDNRILRQLRNPGRP